MNTRPKNPANARNLNCLRYRLVRLRQNPVLAHAHRFCRLSAKKKDGCSYVVVDPKGGVLCQVGSLSATHAGTKSRFSTA